MRVSNEELNKICEKYNTDRLWSWSRVNCVHNSLYEYFLKYILHAKEDRDDSIYKVTGGISHDIIEKFYNGEIAYKQMVEEFKDGWLTAFDIAELKFNRSDSAKNDSIAEKYYYDLENFFKTHQKIPYKVQLEQFITVKIGEEYYQGYIDCCFKDKEGNYVILDWKTSSIYKGAKAQNECGQLCMYAMALHQKGIPYEKIRICWNFLKYCNVKIFDAKYNLSWNTIKGEEKTKEVSVDKIYSTLKTNIKAWMKQLGVSKDDIQAWEENIEMVLAEGGYCNIISYIPKDVITESHLKIEEIDNSKTRQIERCKIGESLYANVKAKMKKLGYDEDSTSIILEQFVKTNDLNCLPEVIRMNYSLDDCFVYVDLTDELIKSWKDYIISTTKMIRDKEAEYEINKDEKIWWEDEESVASQSYYFSNLCGYSAHLHKPYAAYLDKLTAEKNGNLLESTKKNDDEYDENDMSWLEEL